MPGVGTFYDFKKRIIDGPYRKRGKDDLKRSQWNATSHLRDLKSEKEAKKHETDPNWGDENHRIWVDIFNPAFVAEVSMDLCRMV